MGLIRWRMWEVGMMISDEARAQARRAVAEFMAWRSATRQQQVRRLTVVEWIREKLVEGVVLDQQTIREQLGVSKYSVSTAMQRLMAEGLVERIDVSGGTWKRGLARYAYRRVAGGGSE